MYKKMSSLVFFLLFSLTVGMLFTGCSGHSAAPDTTKTDAKHPFHDPPLRMLGELKRSGSTAKVAGLLGGEEEKSGGLCSWLIKMVVDGLQEGITKGVGDATTGKLFSGLNGDSGTSAQYAAINTQLTQISGQVSDLILQNADILSAISVQSLIDQNNTNQGNITSDGKSINTAWGVGSDAAGYTSNSYMDIAKQAKDGTTSNAALKTGIATFINKQYGNTALLQTALIALNTRIITDGILTTYASMLVSEGGIKTAKDAENAYVALQQQFGRILTYQIQAQVMIIEMDNFSDPAGNSARSDMGSFLFMLQGEVANFSKAVNFLMINLADYRAQDNYANESGYMHKYGLAPDTTYNMIFATSRALAAQLIGTGTILTDKAGNKSFQQDYGLHGAIILPKLYRYPASGTGPVAPGTIKVKFKSYSSNQLGFNNYSSTIPVNQPTPSAGRFPYTAWTPSTTTASAKSYPDNNWLFYEFSAPKDFPAGKYHIYLVDGGDNTSPWNHTETLYGNLSVLWYDPSASITASGQGIIIPTTNTIVKFGSFSGRWNWGYNMISESPWIVPSTFNYNLTSDLSIGVGLVSNPYNGRSTSGSYTGPSAPSKYTDSNAFYPAPLNFGMLVNPFPSWEKDEYYYTMNFPFTIAAGIAGYNPVVGAPAVQIYYNISGNITASLFKVDFGYVLNDTTANTTDTIMSFMDQSFNPLFTHSQSESGISIPSNVAINGNDAYNITAHAELNSNYPCLFGGCGERSGSISLNSDMQVVYTGTYSIPGL